MTIMKLLASNAFTALLICLAKILYDIWEKKQDRGSAKVERIIGELETKYDGIAIDVKGIRADIEEKERDSVRTELVLLHDRIWQIFRFFSDRDEISVEDKANVTYLFEEYQKKGGNHHAEEMYKYIETLSIIPQTQEGELEHGMDN